MISKNQIKYIQSLHLKKNREKDGFFIIEGVKLVSEFLESDAFEIKELFATEEYLSQNKLPIKTKNIPFHSVAEEELKKISQLITPNKVLALVAVQKNVLDKELLLSGLTIYLDDIRDPGNLGTIIRIADWFGITQVICSETTTELYNFKTLQATMGAVLRVKVVYEDLENVLSAVPQIPVYGALLNGANIYKTELKKGIVVIGNEANGISESIMKLITQAITIPSAMNNGSESLNAANACGIICSEFFRQFNYR